MKNNRKVTPADNQLYTLEVFIISGPITERFAKKNPVISRTIEIQGEQTLSELHEIIFDAFDWEEEHLYEFQIGGKGPQDPKAKCYGIEDKPAGDATQTMLGSLELKSGQAFGYWFDFGDDWWHQINVVDIGEIVPGEKYPQITKREGKSPPQYPD